MGKYIKYLDLNEGYNPTQTFKSYVESNFEESEVVNTFASIKQPFIERIIVQPVPHESESDMVGLTAMDMIGAMYIYIMDYAESDIFIKFLKDIFDGGSKHIDDFPDKQENLSPTGQNMYRLLQLIGEDVFFELLVKELDTVDAVNQSQVATQTQVGTSVIDGMRKRQAQNFIYKNCVPATHGFFTDQHWAGPSAFWKKLDEYNIDHNLTAPPKYFNWPYDPKRTVDPSYKEYPFEIHFVNNNGRPAQMYGTLRANAAGKVGTDKDGNEHDPLDRYDVTVVVG